MSRVSSRPDRSALLRIGFYRRIPARQHLRPCGMLHSCMLCALARIAKRREPGLRPFETHLLIGACKGDERDEPDRRLFHTRSDAVQRRALQERGMHHPLMHEGL